MSPKQAYFTPALFEFLKQLKKNNNRDWFLKNKARWETEARDPALRFIEDIGPQLRKISTELRAVAKPVGGSLFRINRDIRFSNDKSPYKTNIGMSFPHVKGFESAAPGLYVHIAPGESFGGGGVHHPDGKPLGKIRDAIVTDTGAWKKIRTDPKFKPMLHPSMGALKRAPQSYDPNHPFVEDLKRKNFSWGASYTEAQVTSPDFMERYLEACRAAQPFDRFLAKAVGVSW